MRHFTKLLVPLFFLICFVAKAEALSSQIFEVKLVVDEATATKSPSEYQKMQFKNRRSEQEELWVTKRAELSIDCIADAVLVARKEMPEADVVRYLKDNPAVDERAFRDWVKADSAPELQIVLNERGADKLTALTKENLKKRVAIVLEGEIVTAPVVMTPITGGKISISVGSAEEVRMMAEKIKKAIGLPENAKGLTSDRSGASPAGS